jgi:Protein of unknown function (DUF4239)
MNPLVALAIVVVAGAATVSLMLLVRRFAAPAGGFFTDSDRAAGVFGVTGTGFAVLLAFVIFLAFSSYDRARQQASLEASATSQLFRTANLFPPDARRQLHAELICYARAVIHHEWRTMRDAHESPLVDSWLDRIERTVDGTQLHGDKQRLGFDHWFDQSADRREGRIGRLVEAKPLVPGLVWLALFLGGGLIIVYMCFYADPREPAFVQALQIGSVTTMVVAGLLVVRFLDRPYTSASGGIRPTAMTTALHQMEHRDAVSGGQAARLCGEAGRPKTDQTTSLRAGEDADGRPDRRETVEPIRSERRTGNDRVGEGHAKVYAALPRSRFVKYRQGWLRETARSSRLGERPLT